MPDLAKNDRLTALALQARDGDTAALGQFIALAQGDVWRLCAYLTSPDEADDLTQETFERSIGSLHRFHGESGARPWLLSICRRVCVDSTRRSIRRRRLVDAATRQATLASPTSDLDSTVDIDLAIESLPQDRRDAFTLTQIIGLPYAEAAQVLHVPIGTIRSRVARARLELARTMRADDAMEIPLVQTQQAAFDQLG